jgi:membrane protease YdiL (CAAX protease family)
MSIGQGREVTLSRIIGAAFAALAATMGISGVWAALLSANLRDSVDWPWSVVVMAAVLWLAWRYAGGWGWPTSTAPTRRTLRRANAVSARIWVVALLAGTLSLVALFGVWIVLFQTGSMRGNTLPEFARYPWRTVIAVIAMAALVGAVAEETAFRGYLQGLLERRWRAWLAIPISALTLLPGHAATQGLAWSTAVFYLLVDGMLGTTACLCDSILPGIVIHAAGLTTFFLWVWPADARRIVGSAAVHDPWFWVHVVQILICAPLAVVAFGRLARAKQLSAA